MLDMESFEREEMNLLPATETRGGLATQIVRFKPLTPDLIPSNLNPKTTETRGGYVLKP